MPYLSSISLALNRPGGLSLESQVAALFSGGEQGAWYDPSAANVTWRRNLLTRTEEFDNAAWNKTNLSVSANATTAPDLTSTADKIIAAVGAGGSLQHLTTTNFSTLVAGTDYVFSVYLKAAEYTWAVLYVNGAGMGRYINLTTGGTGNTFIGTPISTTVTDAGNGWWKVVMVVNTGASSNGDVRVYLAPSNGSTSSVGDDASGCFVWGAQFERASAATPYQRIVTPELTYLADVQSQPLLWQSNSGIDSSTGLLVPVWNVEQPVGLIMDKRLGAAYGSEIVTNADDREFNSNTGYWSVGANASITGGVLAISGAANNTIQLSKSSIFTAGKTYILRATIKNYVSGAVRLGVNDGFFQLPAANGTYYVFVNAGIWGATSFGLRTIGANTTLDLDDISIKEVLGNHAVQTSSAARPVLRARYNLLTYSEQFDNTGAWTTRASTVVANSTTAPDGTNTADSMLETTTNDVHRVTQTVTVVSGAVYRLSCYIKPNGRDWALLQFSTGATNAYAYFDVATGNVGIVGAGASNPSITRNPTTGWCLCQITLTATATSAGFAVDVRTGDGGLGYGGDITKGLYLWGADLRVGTSAGTYQRIAAATDYATGAAFPVYLEQPTGGDDSLITANSSFNDFAASDAPFYMAAGVTRYGTTRGTVFCLADNTNATAGNNDTVNLECDSTAQVRGYLLDYDAGGNTETSATAGTLAAEQTFVASWQRTDTDGFARRNGTAGTGADQTAPALTLPLATVMAQRRGSSPTTDQRFTGRLFGLVVRAGAISAGQMSAVENYLAGKAGITL